MGQEKPERERPDRAPTNAERGGGPNPGERATGTQVGQEGRGRHDHARGTPTEGDRSRGSNPDRPKP